MLKNINDVIDFANNQVTVEHGIIAHDKVVAGVDSNANIKITTPTYNHYTDPPSSFSQAFGKAALALKL